MTPEHVRLVKESWAKILPSAEQVGVLLYARLLETYPELGPLFKGDFSEQGRKLMAMIGQAVDGLDDFTPMDPALISLGARHRDYGVQEDDYPKLADALIWTLQQGLGDDLTPEIMVAWVGLYRTLTDTMLAGAAPKTGT